MLTVAIVVAVILFVTVLVIQCVRVVSDARDARSELDEQIRMLSLVAPSVAQTSGRGARTILARSGPMSRILEGIKEDAAPPKKKPRATQGAKRLRGHPTLCANGTNVTTSKRTLSLYSALASRG
jgi:hypothetical protein